jgi:hypothetical protein
MFCHPTSAGTTVRPPQSSISELPIQRSLSVYSHPSNIAPAVSLLSQTTFAGTASSLRQHIQASRQSWHPMTAVECKHPTDPGALTRYCLLAAFLFGIISTDSIDTVTVPADTASTSLPLERYSPLHPLTFSVIVDMGSQQPSSMTLAYLHDSDGPTNRMVQAPHRVLRDDGKPKDDPAPTERGLRSAKKRHEKNVRKLEQEMDAMTNAELLDNAREHQQGKYNITAPRSLFENTADVAKVSRKEPGHSPRTGVVDLCKSNSPVSLSVT